MCDMRSVLTGASRCIRRSIYYAVRNERDGCQLRPNGYAENAVKKGRSAAHHHLHYRRTSRRPARLVHQRGVPSDHKFESEIELYVKIPHHEGYRLWMPAQPNPKHWGWLEALNTGDRGRRRVRVGYLSETRLVPSCYCHLRREGTLGGVC